MLIPKAPHNVDDETATAAKEKLAACEQVEVTLRAQLADVGARAEALTTEAAEASAQSYLAQAGGAAGEEVAELRAASSAKMAVVAELRQEQTALGHACTLARNKVDDARLALTRITHKNQVARIAKHAEKLLQIAVKLETSIGTSAEHYQALLKQIDVLRNIWPTSDFPHLTILSQAGIDEAIAQYTHKVSATIDDYIGMATSRYPGSKCSDPLLHAQPAKIPDLSSLVATGRTHLVSILEGRIDARTGASLAQPNQPVARPIQRGAEIKNGKLIEPAADAAAAV